MARRPDDEESFSTVELSRSECLDLLGTARIGRVVLSDNGIPVAVPVNMSVLDDDVIFSTDAGAKLDAAVHGRVVAVEIDDVDAIYRTGWSVLVTGIAHVITEQADVDRARRRLAPWAPGPHPFIVRVPSTLVSGRRLAWVDFEIPGSARDA